jgi:tRNA (guanine-N7-)-methyltransferase
MTAAPRRLYGRRKGKRLRTGQEALLNELLPRLAVALPAPGRMLEPASLFAPRREAVWLEVGFGGGEHLSAQASAHPEVGFIGCEPFINGVVKLLAEVQRRGFGNVRIHAGDARPLLEALAPASIARIFALFPDPWPKKRHHKRRLIQPETLDLFARVMADLAELRIATDDPDYAAWMLAAVARHGAFAGPAGGDRGFTARPDDWPPTRYEAKALRRGACCRYFLYHRSAVAGEGPAQAAKNP